MDVWKMAILGGTAIAGVAIVTDKKMPANRKLKYMGIVMGSGVGLYLGRDLYVQWMTQREIEQRQTYQVLPGVNLWDVATDIHDAFFNADWLGFTEDELQAIIAIGKVPPEHVKAVAEIYAQRYGRNMYNDFRQFLSNQQYESVAPHLMS